MMIIIKKLFFIITIFFVGDMMDVPNQVVVVGFTKEKRCQMR